MKKHLLYFLLVASPLCTMAQPCLVSSFPFNGNANDVAGSHNATVNGATLVPDRLGNPNSAYSFDGVNDYIDIPEEYDYPEKTVSLWFNATSVSTNLGTIFTCDNPTLVNGNMEATTIEVGGVDYLRICAGGTAANFHDHAINTNMWYHLAIVKTSTSYRYYLNCALIAIVSDSDISSGAGDPVSRFGAARQVAINRYFHGIIDSACITNCALSDLEICNIYNSQAELHQSEIIFDIYPNPATTGTAINFTVNKNENSTLEVFDVTGQKVFSQQVNNSESINLDVALFAPGMYIATLQTEKNGILTRKFIIK